jgi:D-xylose transport system substrate-binding protein
MFALAVVGLLATGSMVACTSDGSSGNSSSSGGSKGGNGTGKIGVILPDTASSQRWVTDDARFLKQSFDAAGIPVDIQNAQGDKTQFQTIADGMIASGVKVLITANLDSGTGKAVLDKAKANGIATIDYDRMTLNGGANYYVSFDNVEVGKLQGQGLEECLTQMKITLPLVADLNGSPTDNNATLFKKGYESVLQPKYDSAAYKKGPDQDVPDWSNTEAGVIFEQMMTQTGNRINAVLAANDGLANAAIAILKKNKLNGRVPVTGQDATVQGLQNILVGDQCMTVYKSIRAEAQAAADLAIKIYKGQKGDAGDRVKDPESGAYIPSVLLKPEKITKANVDRVIRDGFVTRKAICSGQYETYCAQNGI